MRPLLPATLLLMVLGAPLSAQVAKPAGLKAAGASRPKADSAAGTAAVSTPSLVPPKIEMPEVKPPAPKRSDAATARDRAGLAKATRAMQQGPKGTPASSGRRTPPLDD